METKAKTGDLIVLTRYGKNNSPALALDCSYGLVMNVSIFSSIEIYDILFFNKQGRHYPKPFKFRGKCIKKMNKRKQTNV